MKLLKIGRGQECDIVIEDVAVSRVHAELFQDDEGNVFLTDLESSNGTFINGKQLHGSEVLNHHDIIKIGNTVLPWRNYLKGVEAPTEDLKSIRKEKAQLQPNKDEITPGIRKRMIVFSLAFVAVAFIEFMGLQYDRSADGFSFFIGFMLYLFVVAIVTLVLVLILRAVKVKNPYIIVGLAGVGLLFAVYLGYQGAV